jgi:hypothetical protein
MGDAIPNRNAVNLAGSVLIREPSLGSPKDSRAYKFSVPFNADTPAVTNWRIVMPMPIPDTPLRLIKRERNDTQCHARTSRRGTGFGSFSL